MMIKVICMLLVGIMFFVVALISYVTRRYFDLVMLSSLIIFSIYGIGKHYIIDIGKRLDLQQQL